MNKLNLMFVTILLALFCNAGSAQTLDTIKATYTDSIYAGYSTGSCSAGCNYTLPVIVPAGFRIVDVTYSFSYSASGTCLLDQAGFNVSLSSCQTECISCTLNIPGVCHLVHFSMYDSIKNCLPTPKCINDTINFVLNFARHTGPGGCSLSCLLADQPWSITVIGYIDSLPKANFSLAQDTNQLHHYIATNLATGKPPLSYDWSWGDGTHDYSAYPSHTYADSGFYNICLTVTDSNGCMNTFCDSSFHILRTTDYMVYVNVVAPLGVAEITNKPLILSIYPNPSNTQITINTKFIHPDEVATVSIINVLGQQVLPSAPIQLQKENAVIDISNLPSGVYFLQIKSDRGIAEKKFVKE